MRRVNPWRFLLLLTAALIISCQPLNQRDDTALAESRVRIGVFMPLTGETANFGVSAINGITLAAEEVNATGGINGKLIKLFVQDTRSDTSETETVVNRLIQEYRVHALLGEVASSRSLAAATIAQQAKVPMLTPSSTNPEITQKGSYIFRSCYTDPFQGAALAQFAANTLQAQRAAIMIDRKHAYSVGLAQFIREAYSKMGGQIVNEQLYAEGDLDFAAQLTSIKDANPDVLFVPGYYTEVGLIAQSAKKLGLNVPLVGGDGWDSPHLYEVGGQALVGSYFSNHYSMNDPDPAVQKFVSDYQSIYNSVPDAWAATAYDAAHIMFDAIRRAGSSDGTAIRDALAKTVDFPGITGKVTFNAQHDPVKPIVIIRVEQGGKYQVAERVTPEGTVVPLPAARSAITQMPNQARHLLPEYTDCASVLETGTS